MSITDINCPQWRKLNSYHTIVSTSVGNMMSISSSLSRFFNSNSLVTSQLLIFQHTILKIDFIFGWIGSGFGKGFQSGLAILIGVLDFGRADNCPFGNSGFLGCSFAFTAISSLIPFGLTFFLWPVPMAPFPSEKPPH